MANNNIVVVFDFDKTIIDVDSDNWVIDKLGFTDLFNQLLPTMPWNTLMDHMMKELHDQGKTIDEIKQVLRTIPIHPRVVPAIKSAHDLGCELRILSDANMFFIETIVDNLGISELFSEISSNSGLVDEHDTLRIFPYHDFNKSSHGCSHQTCPPNMCKGLVMEKIQESIAKEGKKKKMIYLGDGAGDYCPSLKLNTQDYVMPRKNFPVWDLISENQMVVKATIREWTDGESLESVLMEIIKEIITLEEEKEKEKKMLITNSHVVDNTCKISIGINEPIMPLALEVSQSS